MSAADHCPAVFVTGTDTGVGKTIVSAALARYLTTAGAKVEVMKPFETGVTDPERPGPDAELLAWAADSTTPIDLIAPYRFEPPVAPAQALGENHAVIDIEEVLAKARKLRESADFVIIEGAGGLMVPICGGFLMADFALQLGIPTLVVTRPGLGTINHTLLTVFAARNMGLPLAGFLINGMPERPDLAEREAPHMLAALASAELLGVLPQAFGNDHEKVDTLARYLPTLPTLPWLLDAIGTHHRQK